MKARLFVAVAVFCTAAASAGRISAEGKAFNQLKTQAGPAGAGLAAEYRGSRPERGHQDRDRGPVGGMGREEAVRACMNAQFDSDKQTCIKAANAAQFFDPAAATACGGMTFGSYIAGCLNAIANKSYMADEVTLCSNNSFDSGKISCFQNAGRQGMPDRRPRWERRPDVDGYILERLRGIRAELQSGNIAKALMSLGDLIGMVEEGSRP